MRGRKPVPTSLHRLRGTFDASRHGAKRSGEPKAEGSLTTPPGWMDAGQRQLWRSTVRSAPADVLHKVDAQALAVWVVAAEEHRRASVALAAADHDGAHPLLVETERGLVPSPYLAVINKSALRMLRAASELGFTPASRPRISVAGSGAKKSTSPWDRFAVVDGGKKA